MRRAYVAVAAALACAVAASAGRASAATFYQTSVEALARTSDAVVRARVLRTASRLTRDGRIVTEVELAVDEAWKGAPGRSLRLLVPGGRVGRLAMTVDAAPGFEVGEEVVVFAARRGSAWHVNGHALGKYRIERSDGRAAASLGGARVLPRRLAAGERAVESMGVAELERRVRSAR